MRLTAILIIGLVAAAQGWAEEPPSKPTTLIPAAEDHLDEPAHGEKRTATVAAQGLGGTVESAAQNALTQVIGSFIDSEKLLEKHTEISDGIRSETTSINSDIREYSQGVIQEFDVVATTQDGPIIKIQAKVIVRIDDFKAYIRKVAEAEVVVDTGLFAKISTQQKQAADKQSIIAKIVESVLRGEVVKFNLDKPQALSMSHFMKDHVKG